MRSPLALFLRTSRSTLFWFAVTVIVPVVALGVYNGLEGRRQALNRAGLEASRLAAAVAEQHRSMVESVHALMVLTGRDDALGAGGGECEDLLATMAQRSPLVSGLARASGDGRVTCAAGPFGPHLTAPEVSAMGEAALTGDFTAGPGFVTGTGGALVPFALPLAAVDADGLPLYLIAEINLDWLQERIDRLEAPSGSLVLVTDHRNTIITTAPRLPELIGRHLPRGASVGGDGAAVAEATLTMGRPRVVAMRDFRHGIRVAVALEQRAVLAAADAAFGRSAGLLIVVSILSLVLANVIGDRAFVAPLRRLTGAAGAMADANLSSRVGGILTAAGEIRELATTFDTMAERLQRRETDLTAANGRLSAVIDAAQDGILTIDGNGIIRAANPAGARMLGYAEGELTGMPVTALMADTPRNRRLILLVATGRHRGGGFRREITARHRVEGRLPVRVSLGRYDDTHGPRFVAVVHDVSGEKRQEAELRRARKAAEQASAAKSAFLATMSHELRTPLNAILGFSETIRDRVLGPDPDGRFYVPYAGHIHEAGTHLLTLINDILDLSKLEAGKTEVHPEPTACGALAEAALLLVAGLAERRGVRLSADIPPGLPPVMVDPRAGKQMLVNLLSNAVRFTDTDGTVEVRVRGAGAGCLALTVRDSGIGMTPGELASALEPFGQAHGYARRADAGGTGLGLPLVKALTELHGGRFHISSTKGEGTAVTLVLAAADGDRATRPDLDLAAEAEDTSA